MALKSALEANVRTSVTFAASVRMEVASEEKRENTNHNCWSRTHNGLVCGFYLCQRARSMSLPRRVPLV